MHLLLVDLLYLTEDPVKLEGCGGIVRLDLDTHLLVGWRHYEDIIKFAVVHHRVRQ